MFFVLPSNFDRSRMNLNNFRPLDSVADFVPAPVDEGFLSQNGGALNTAVFRGRRKRIFRRGGLLRRLLRWLIF